MSVTLKQSLQMVSGVPYDRALQNTAFVKNDESSAVCWGFSEKSRQKLSPLISY